jgi:AraC-like DNA-binding protein
VENWLQADLSEPPSLQATANAASISERQLQRKLAEENISFREILSQLRYKRARQLIGSTDATISEIAIELGYSALPNFTRAFTYWSGLSPAEYRAQKNQR